MFNNNNKNFKVSKSNNISSTQNSMGENAKRNKHRHILIFGVESESKSAKEMTDLVGNKSRVTNAKKDSFVSI